MAVEWRSVWSSHVDRIGYDAGNQNLHVQYTNGPETIYSRVPSEKWQKINASVSIGSALHELVRGQHDFRHA